MKDGDETAASKYRIRQTSLLKTREETKHGGSHGDRGATPADETSSQGKITQRARRMVMTIPNSQDELRSRAAKRRPSATATSHSNLTRRRRRRRRRWRRRQTSCQPMKASKRLLSRRPVKASGRWTSCRPMKASRRSRGRPPAADDAVACSRQNRHRR
jgi:hypothetical protein